MSTVKCPQCAADNRGGASFCDQCGAALSAPGTSTAPAERRVNWPAIIVLIAIVGAIGWFLFGPATGSAPVAGAPAVAGANPHGGGAGGAEAGAMPDLKLEESKAQLATDPLNTDALANLYNAYGMIGRGNEVRPYLDRALATLLERETELGDAFEDTGIRLGMVAAMGEDLEGSLLVFEKLLEVRPDSHSTKRMLGDVRRAMEQYEVAIDWYTRYLADVSPEDNPRDYWDTYYRRATSYLDWYEVAPVEERDIKLLKSSQTDLEQITVENPDYVEAWQSLGDTYNLNGDQEAAISAWEQARDRSTDDTQRWTAAAAIARVRGEEIPPRPASMVSGMGTMGGGGSPEEVCDDPSHSHGGV